MNSIAELISQIKLRPTMYIGRSSISCLKAFLDGWFLRSPDTVTDSSVMEDFQNWVTKKYSIKTPHSWCDIILFHSQDESDALTNFFKHFDKWRSDCPPT